MTVVSRADLEAYAEALEEQARRRASNLLDRFRPYPKQMEFYATGLVARERGMMAGNQCLAPDSVIETAVGQRQIGEMIGAGGFGVRSWDGVSGCVAQSSPVFLRGFEPAFRLHLDNGLTLECSHRHQLLTVAGWFSLDQLMSRAGGLRWTGKGQGSQGCYGAGDRPDGQQLHPSEGICQGSPPSQADVHKCSLSFLHEGEAEQISQRNRSFPPFDHRTTFADGRKPLVARSEMSGCQNALPISGHSQPKHRDVAQHLFELGRTIEEVQAALSTEAEAVRYGGDLVLFFSGAKSAPTLQKGQGDPQSAFVAGPQDSWRRCNQHDRRTQIFVPFEHLPLVGFVRIVSVEAIGCKPILDITVEGTNCYQAVGLINHNCGKTFAGAAEVSFHLTGRYPGWWPGRRYGRPIRVWSGSDTTETTRDTVQTNLLGPPSAEDEWGTAAIPRDALGTVSRRQGVANAVDTVRVKHVSGGTSVLGFKSYDQGRQKWQGAVRDLVWLDEECPMEIYTEALTRTNTVEDGMLMLTFTPLLGQSEVVRMFTRPEGSE